MVVVVVVAAVVLVAVSGASVVAGAVSTGASVVSSSTVGFVSSPPQDAASSINTATRVRDLGVFTSGECIRGWGTTGIPVTGSLAAMGDLVSFAAAELSQRADAAKAGPMAAYLKTDMPFYGVQKKGRTEVLRAVKKQFPIEDNHAYREAILSLWAQPHREEKYLAIAIAKEYAAFLSHDNVDLYRRLIVEGAWWDLVDDVAIKCVGIVHRDERDKMAPVIEQWVDDEDMWLRRTSLISPIKHKADTDYETLFDHCLRRAHEKEFFIRKAIGWTLREYAKTEPDRVRNFLLEHRDRWSGLSFREAAKHLDVT